ncbi:ATP phosphoribosyltransferase involved in histidine biosynthesis [Hahella chejuensis KCTC 2396]|nr:ATP phosphoribosyltransferase involved in histidine biosynthesis [Hahella chejuensis KCTC 2396]
MFGDTQSMSESDLWLLPDGVEELLPPEATRIEELRRQLLDLYHSWGYEMIVPPLLEFLDSLLIGVGRDLELEMFKVTDQLTGRLMGIRADMTPQVARIDSRRSHDVASRFCYIGSVLRTKSPSMFSSRTPIQTGCELYGVVGSAADIEIISLMLETLNLAKISPLHMDIAHVGVYQAILAEAKLSKIQSEELFEALRRKAIPEVDEIAATIPDKAIRQKVMALPRLAGGKEKMKEARKIFAGNPDIEYALDEMSQVAAVIGERYPEVEIYFDFCEMRGYKYYTGLVFAAYTEGLGQAVAKGGRYDEVGRDFGRGRPAMGFSVDLKALYRMGKREWAQPAGAILAPNGQDAELWELIRQLRRSNRVIQLMPGEEAGHWASHCDRQIVRDESGQWIVKPLTEFNPNHVK